MAVIPGIHRPYDDYQFRYARQFSMQVASTQRRPYPGRRSDEGTQPEKEGDR
jgi:hypothetical protein